MRQFVAEGRDRTWSSTLTVLIQGAGSGDVCGRTVQQRQAHDVGVFVRPEYRGSGVIDALFETAVGWAWSVVEVARVRLYFHEPLLRRPPRMRSMTGMSCGASPSVVGKRTLLT